MPKMSQRSVLIPRCGSILRIGRSVVTASDTEPATFEHIAEPDVMKIGGVRIAPHAHCLSSFSE